jgi:DNA-binding HxlR family transcriptional regulator
MVFINIKNSWHKFLGTNSPLHFNKLKRILSGISNKVLSERSQQLEREKIVIKTTTNDEPNDILYSLTPLALEFQITLQNIDSWIDEWIEYKSSEQEKNNLKKIGGFLWVVKMMMI